MKRTTDKPRNHVQRAMTLRGAAGQGKHVDKRRRAWFMDGMRMAKDTLNRYGSQEDMRELTQAAIRRYKGKIGIP